VIEAVYRLRFEKQVPRRQTVCRLLPQEAWIDGFICVANSNTFAKKG